MILTHFRKIILLLILCLMPVSWSAFAESENPQASIENFLGTIRSMSFPVTDTAQYEQKTKQASVYLDLQSMGQQSLGKHWEAMAPDEQTRFMELLWKLIESIAYPRTNAFLGDQTISYTGEKALAKGVEVSSSVLDSETELNVPIVYHLYQDGSHWKIYDIFMDGVSMTEDLQYQFDKMIEDGSVQTLLDRMSERLEQAQKKLTGN